MVKLNEIDRRILETMTGRDRIKALLKERDLTLKGFAEKYNEWVENVSRCIAGDSPHPEIRDNLATELGIDRAGIDQLIDGGEA